MNELHLFAGAGGGILAGQLLGNRCVCAVEFEPYAQAILVARQNDGTFPPFAIWDDVRTFDGRRWRGIADVVAGGFPCQDISVSGGGQELMESSPASGDTWPASFTKFDHSTSKWKTAQLSLLGDSVEFSEIWPRWGLMRDGECWERTKLVGHISENASGLLPTPLKDDWKGGTSAPHSKTGKPRTDQFRHWCKVLHGLTYPIPEHSEAVMGWPIGHTDLKPLETDKFREWQQQHSIF